MTTTYQRPIPPWGVEAVSFAAAIRTVRRHATPSYFTPADTEDPQLMKAATALADVSGNSSDPMVHSIALQWVSRGILTPKQASFLLNRVLPEYQPYWRGR